MRFSLWHNRILKFKKENGKVKIMKIFIFRLANYFGNVARIIHFNFLTFKIQKKLVIG